MGKGERVHKCFPKHSRMGKARIKQHKEIEEGKQRRVNMGKKYSGQKIKDVPTVYLQLGPTDFPGSLLPEAADGLPKWQKQFLGTLSI